MDLDDIDALLDKVKNLERPKKKTKSTRKRSRTNQSGKGYTYEWNETTKKLELKHRLLMAEKLGRPLQDYESVFFKDRDRSNLKIDNLAVGLKPGFGLADIICPHCEEKHG